MKTILRSFILVIFLLVYSQEIVNAYETQGQLVTVKVHSQSLENNIFNDTSERNVSVYLPPGYDANIGKNYPVIYLLSWENSTSRSWFNIPGDVSLEKILDTYILSGKIEPMIIVVPDGKNKLNGCWYTNSDLTGNWEDFIVSALVDYVDSHFRTLPFSECRGIAGHSMGGYGALKMATKHPEVFSAVYALNAFVDFESVFNDTVIWKSSLEKAVEVKSFPTRDPFADNLLAMATAFAPDENNPPLYGSLFKTKNGNINEAVVEKWLEQDPKNLINTFSDNLKRLKAIAIDYSNSDALINLGSNYSKSLNEHNIEHIFRYYSGNQDSLLLDRVRDYMLPMFSITLDHSLLKVLNYRHTFSKSDKVSAKLLKSGTIYVVPSETSGNLQEIVSNKKMSIHAAPGELYEIPLKELTNGIYRIYGVSSGGFIDKPVEFGVNGGTPTIKICAVDSYTDQGISCNLAINGVTIQNIPVEGFKMSVMGDVSICLKKEGHSVMEKTVTVYTDSTFTFPLVRDSYLKVIDKATNEPVTGATVTHNQQGKITDAKGLTRIKNLQNGTLDCRIFKQGYFTELVSVPLVPGETATAQVTRKKARVDFIFENDHKPVHGLIVSLNEMEAATDQNGMASFTELNARNEHTFQINGSCYESVKETFYLETDTTIRITLEPGITRPGMPIVQTGESLLLNPWLNGTFYIVPEGTESNQESVRMNAVWVQYAETGLDVNVNLNDFPNDLQYVIFFIAEECSNILKSGQTLFNIMEKAEDGVIIYPNPAKDLITIQLNQPQRFTVEIMNVHGKNIYQSEETGISHIVDLLSFSNGIYFVNVKSSDFNITHKILKQ
jgi:S-formylglutathione hydrolase